MTELIKRPVSATILWWPVILRLSLWCYIAMTTAMLTALHSLTPEVQAAVGLSAKQVWWIGTFCEVTAAGAIAIRMYLDNSFSKHSEKVNANNEENPISPVTRSPAG